VVDGHQSELSLKAGYVLRLQTAGSFKLYNSKIFTRRTQHSRPHEQARSKPIEVHEYHAESIPQLKRICQSSSAGKQRNMLVMISVNRTVRHMPTTCTTPPETSPHRKPPVRITHRADKSVPGNGRRHCDSCRRVAVPPRRIPCNPPASFYCKATRSDAGASASALGRGCRPQQPPWPLNLCIGTRRVSK
jgi:hypothetical protein